MRQKKLSGKRGGIKKLFRSSREKGKACELLFKQWCVGQGAVAVRIHDGVKGPSHAGAKQIGDFLVFHNKKVCVVDVKSERAVRESRLRQLGGWLHVSGCSGFDKFAFVFVWPHGLHYLKFKDFLKFQEAKGTAGEKKLIEFIRRLDSVGRLF